MSRKSVTNQTHTLYRVNAMGFTETVQFVGSLKNKPKGWKVRK